LQQLAPMVIIGGITVVNEFAPPGELIPFASVIALAKAFSQYIVDPCLTSIYKSFSHSELDLFCEKYRRIS